MKIETTSTKYACPTCGMSRDAWPNFSGVEKDGVRYCCAGCANGEECRCEADIEI